MTTPTDPLARLRSRAYVRLLVGRRANMNHRYHGRATGMLARDW